MYGPEGRLLAGHHPTNRLFHVSLLCFLDNRNQCLLLLRVGNDSLANFGAWRTAEYFQKYRFCHGLSCELEMDVRKGKRVDLYGRKRQVIAQTWRQMSTQPNYSEGCEKGLVLLGDAESGNLRSQMEVVTHAISSNVSIISISESGNAEAMNDPVVPATHGIESRIDEELVPPEKHLVTMEVGWSVMRFIKGKGGVTQGEIEAETGVKIVFPASKYEDSIIIEGSSTASVSKASEQIQSIIDKAVNSRDLDYSHFVSLPLAIHPGLVGKLVNFQNKILGITTLDEEKKKYGDSNGDASEEEYEEQPSVEASNVSVAASYFPVEASNFPVAASDVPSAASNTPIEASKDSVEAPSAPVETSNVSLEAINVFVESKAKSDDPNHSTKTHVPALELKAGRGKTFVKVNIPLVSYQPKKSLQAPTPEASSSILRDCGVDKSIFIKPTTFHLTVLMLKLWNKDRVKAAAEILQSVSSEVRDALENRPVSIRIKGLECMKGSLSKARVLYAPVEEIGGEGRLLRACQVIIDAYVAAGLVMEKDAEQKLKLHATLMNARIKGRRRVDSFDARGIFDLYGSEEWGDYLIPEAHLSQRFVYDENGYYHCCASIPFPQNMKVE